MSRLLTLILLLRIEDDGELLIGVPCTGRAMERKNVARAMAFCHLMREASILAKQSDEIASGNWAERLDDFD